MQSNLHNAMYAMKRTIKSFVLRAGRQTTRQRDGLTSWLKDYELPYQNKPWNFDALFGPNASIIVEIGFGMGASLLTMAQNNPNQYYLGIEVHQAGIGGLAADLHHHQLSNVRIVPHDAQEIFKHCIPPHSLDGIQIFFPDPWPKKRHHKRRLIQAPFIELLVHALKPGGFLHCATDWEDYAQEMLMVLEAAPGLKNQALKGGYMPRPASRPITKFEARGQKLGHGVWDLFFIAK